MKKTEIETVNKENLSKYLEKNKIVLNTFDELKAYKSGTWSERIQTFEELKNSLKERISDVIDRTSFLKKELDTVNNHHKNMKDVTVFENDEYYHRKVFFKSGFEDFIFNRKEPDYSEKLLQIGSLLGLHYGSELGKYKIYLEELLNPSQTKQIKVQKSTTLTQQLLGLYYLGVIPDLRKNDIPETKISEILSLILGMDKQNIRTQLRTLPEKIMPQTDKIFLKELEVLFRKSELIKEADKIKNDMAK